MSSITVEGINPGTDSAPTPPEDTNDAVIIKDSYDSRLANQDLAPLKKQSWSWYNIFAFWMSDVHSVGGYVTAGSLFALGIASWQVLVALIVGIVIVQVFANLVAKPSQRMAVPFPVTTRFVFGIKGANVPAIIRGLIAVAWYGVQTFLASESLNIIFLKFIPGSQSLATEYSFLGLSALGWISYAILWVAQACVFWQGMDTIRKFIDWAGPLVYVVMLVLAIYLVIEAGGLGNIDLNLSSGEPKGFVESIPIMITAVALVVSYFAGPMLNFGDFSRYSSTFKNVRKGNFWGLPVNFLMFSVLTVVCASATVPVFGKLITDPIETVEQIGAPFAILLGGLTFVIATVGINIVANFVSPAFDFSHVNPKKISWRTGGMIAAVGSVIITPWNWYANDQAIHYTLDLLGALIGPLFGILIAGYYVVSKQRVVVDDMFTMAPSGRYWYHGGFNLNAIWALVIAGIPAIASAILPSPLKALGLFDITWISNYSWFLGAGLGYLAFWLLERYHPQMPHLAGDEPGVNDGSRLRESAPAVAAEATAGQSR